MTHIREEHYIHGIAALTLSLFFLLSFLPQISIELHGRQLAGVRGVYIAEEETFSQIVVEQTLARVVGENVGSTSSGSFSTTPEGGNAIIVAISGWKSGGYDVDSVTDNNGNTYERVVFANDPFGTQSGTAIYAAYNISASGTFTITVHNEASSGNFMEWSAIEVSGLATTSPVDRTATAQGASGSTNVTITTSSQTTQADELVVSSLVFDAADADANINLPSGYTSIAVNQDAVVTIGYRFVYKIVSSTGAQSAAWTYDAASGGTASSLATFKAASLGGGDDGDDGGDADDYVVPAPTTAYTFPVGASANNRYLIDENGDPFLIQGEGAWSMLVQLTEAEAEVYLDDREDKGINAIIVNLIESKYSDNPPANANGDEPFTTPGDFSTPNPDYFEHIDAVLTMMAERGIIALLNPAYMGFEGQTVDSDTDGWWVELEANGATTSKAFGEWLGNRYQNLPNIIWVAGGDQIPPEDEDGALNQLELLKGIQENAPDQLWTAHWNNNAERFDPVAPESLDVDLFASYMDVNGVYTYEDEGGFVHERMLDAYNREDPIPTFLWESFYEGPNHHEFTTSLDMLRRIAYEANLSGSTGNVSGSNFIWAFGYAVGGNGGVSYDWTENLDSPGILDIVHVKEFFEDIAWYELEPDQNHTFVTSGYGTFGTTNYVPAAFTDDGLLGVVYISSTGTSTRSITVDMSELTGSVTAQWFNPTNGDYTTVTGSPFTSSGSKTFTTPGDNGTGTNDWVLLLEGTAPDTTDPIVSLTAPNNGATVSGTIAVSASASDNVGVVGVQFKLDGSNLGSEDTSSPYSISWDTTGVDDGDYALTAVARDAAGNTKTSGSRTVTVDNTDEESGDDDDDDDDDSDDAGGGGGGGGGSSDNDDDDDSSSSSSRRSSGGGGGSSSGTSDPNNINSTTGGSPGSSSGTGSGSRINGTYSRGSNGGEVTVLQTKLIDLGYLAPGNATGYYGPLTESAVQAFQRARGIVSFGTPDTTGYGAFGPRTRDAMNAFFGLGTSSIITTPPLTSTPPADRAALIASIRSQIEALQIQVNILIAQLAEIQQ